MELSIISKNLENFIEKNNNILTTDNYYYVINSCIKQYVNDLRVHKYLEKCIIHLQETNKIDFDLNNNFVSGVIKCNDKKIMVIYLGIYAKFNKKLNKTNIGTFLSFIVDDNNENNFDKLIDFNDEIISYLEKNITVLNKPFYNEWQPISYFTLESTTKIFNFLMRNNLINNNIIFSKIMTHIDKKIIYNVFMYLSTINFKFTNFHLNLACVHQCVKSLNFLLNNKINFTEHDVKSVFYERHCEKDELLYIKCFIEFGYVPTKNILLQLLNCGINVEKSMIKNEYLEDADFMKKVCSLLNNNVIYPNAFNIKPDDKTLLQCITKHYKLDEFKKLIKNNNLKPTIECLREACKKKSNKAMIKFLMEKHGVKPDEECVKNSINAYGNDQIMIVFDEYKKK